MSHREILVAASDSDSREQMAESFREAGYDVETTDSTTHLFCSVLEKKIPVVLLGSGTDRKIALSDLVPLLKKCNRRVTIILVSDEESLPTVRSIRQEGIFYHALTPIGEEDRAEILAAVECAFSKAESLERDQPSTAPVTDAADPASPLSPVPDGTSEGISAPVASENSGSLAARDPTDRAADARPRDAKKTRYAAAALVCMLTVVIAGFAYCVSAAFGGTNSSDVVVWTFLGFCALIIVGRLLPALTAVREAGKAAALHRHETDGEKDRA